MEDRKTSFKSSSVWICPVLTLQLTLQVLRCSSHVQHSGALDYDENNVNYNPRERPETYKIPGHIKDQSNYIDYLMGYEFQGPHRIPENKVENKDMELFKRSAKGDRTREKLRRMIKRNRLFHKGRLSIKNGSAVEDNIALEQPKQFNRGSSYIDGKHMFVKDGTNKKTPLISNDNQNLTKNDNTQTKLYAVFNVSNTSNNKNKHLLKLDYPLLTEDGISSQSINSEEKNKGIYGNSTYREIKKDEINKKNKKRLHGKNKTNREENKELKQKHGLISPIKNVLRKKLKSKMRKISENTNYDNANERNDKARVDNVGKCSINKHLHSKIKPEEVHSDGVDGNLKNVSLINHGFLKAFEKRYYDNHLNETKSKQFLKAKAPGFSVIGNENYTGFDDTSKKIKSNDWKEWSGFNVGDYYEPVILFNDKEPFDSKSLKNQDTHLPKKSSRITSVKNIGNKEVEPLSIPQGESDNYVLKTKVGENEHHKKKRYMFSGKAKHKIHAKTVDGGKTRGARDINSGKRKNNNYYGSVFHEDNESFDYDENKDIDDEIFNRYNDNEMPGLVLEATEEKDSNRQTFHRLKKDDSYLKKTRTHKSKKKDENIYAENENKFRKSNSRKAQESGYNGEEQESSDVCVGYKCDDILNTTDRLTTVYTSDSTVTTKRNNNGKSKTFSKSKKTNVETKNSTNRTNEIDEHGLFLCGQLADDFVKAVFTKVKRSRKILKELGFGNETEQSCNRCIETKSNKLPDLEVLKGTLGKCSAQNDVKHKNSKCHIVPDPMESFINVLLSLGKDDEESGRNRLRDDSSFIFNGDDFESFAKNDNGAAINDKYSEGRESVNKDTLEKQHLREEGDDEKIEDGGSNSRKNSLVENDQEDSSKDDQGEVYQSIDEELESKRKPQKNVEINRFQQDSREPQSLQSEENLKGNDLIDVFEGQDPQNPARHKYQTYKELKNDNNINKKIKLKVMPKVSNVDYSNDECIKDVPINQLYERKNINYLNNKPNKVILEQGKQNVQSINVLGNTRKQTYQRDNLQELSVNFEPHKLNINPIETRHGFPGTEHNVIYGDTNKYLPNSQNRIIQSKIMNQNSNRYVDDPLSESGVGSLEYQLFPGQLNEGGLDRSYNAMPFYVDNQRMGKRETPSDTNDEEVIFFELPNIEYDLY